MDLRPFFEFNLNDFDDQHVLELKKFTKTSFDLESIISDASNLKFHKALVEEIQNEFDAPSEEWVKLFASRVYPGRITQQVKEQFTELLTKAARNFLREKVNDRIQSALEKNETNHLKNEETEVNSEDVTEEGIVTTEEEIEAFRIIRAIGSELINPKRIFMRDAKSYCAILFDNNNRRTICRLYFGKRKMSVSLFTPPSEKLVHIEKVSDLYLHKKNILAAIEQYINPEASTETSTKKLEPVEQ